MLLVFLLVRAVILSADTLYLRDGSVLTGALTHTIDNGYILSTANGEVQVPQSEVLYLNRESPGVKEETFILFRDGTTVLAHLQRTVPAPGTRTGSFRFMIPGSVKSVSAKNIGSIPYETQEIAGNSLVTISYDSLAETTDVLTFTALQPLLPRHDPSGTLTLHLRYVPDKAETLKVIVKYPVEYNVKFVSPPAKIHLDGLIVWEYSLKRQQDFNPQVILAPRRANPDTYSQKGGK